MKKFYSILFACLLVFFMAGCENDDAPSGSDAGSISEGVIQGVNTAISQGTPVVINSLQAGKAPAVLYYTSPITLDGGITISGTWTCTNDPDYLPISFNGTITFNGYTGDGVTLTGTVTMTANINSLSDYNFSASCDDMTVIYNSTEYAVSFTVQLTNNSYTSEFVINGETFNY